MHEFPWSLCKIEGCSPREMFHVLLQGLSLGKGARGKALFLTAPFPGARC